MQNRMTFMERMSGRLAAIETILKKLEPVESLLERITLLENNIFTTKRVFTFQEACMYIGVSESMLYKLTSSKEIPHTTNRAVKWSISPRRNWTNGCYRDMNPP